MKKRGLILAALGLIAGLAVGVTIQELKLRVARELREMLDQEAHTSAGCEFQAKSIQVSLLGLNVIARDPAIVCGGEKKLYFKKIRAAFSLARLREHIILLSRLELLQGGSEGFAPDSPTYKFINSLAAPLPPEKDYPGRWKLKMQHLEMSDAVFRENFSFGAIEAQKARLIVQRTPDNNFTLSPVIGSLVLKTSGSDATQSRALGELSSQLTLADEFVDFKRIALALKQSLLQGELRASLQADEAINGKAQFKLDNDAYPLNDKASFAIEGQGRIAGTFSNPDIHASLAGSAALLSSDAAKESLLEFKQISADFELRTVGAELVPRLVKLDANSESSSLHLTQALELRGEGLSGKLAFSADSLNSNGIALKGLKLSSTLGGTASAPSIRSEGTLESAAAGGISLGPLAITLALQSDQLELNLADSSPAGGDLQAYALYSLDAQRSGLRALSLKFEQYHPRFAKNASSRAGLSVIDGKIQLAPTSKGGELEGSGGLNFSFLPGLGQALALQLDLHPGLLNVKLSNAGESFKGVCKLNLSRGQSSVELQMRDFELQEAGENKACSKISAALSYTFDLQSALSGDGEIKLGQVKLGCDPYALANSTPQTFQIHSGELSIPNLALRGPESELRASGKVSLQQGYALRADGDFNLAALVALAPALDNLSGAISLHADLRGDLSTPLFAGQAVLHNGELTLESANTEITELEAKLVMQGEAWNLENLRGRLNDGEIDAHGRLYPLDIARSNLELKLNNILIAPEENTSIVFSADLGLAQKPDAAALLSGDVIIENAEIQRNIDISTFLRAALSFVIPSSSRVETKALPEIDLDLSVQAGGDLFVLTNWLGAEFAADLKVAGTLNDPKLNGKLETINGWFGFRERRFEISSGLINFKPTEREPSLELISEAPVYSLSGDNLIVVLEARGPISSPKITLSSDSGLSQREILALLTATGNLPGASRIGEAKTGIQIGEIPILRDESAFIVGRFLRNLASVDSVVLEPTYNVQRGSIEPTVIASKSLTDRLTLIGESFLGSNVTESNLKLRLALSNQLSLTGIASSESTKKNTALGADLAYSILVDKRRTLELELQGNDSFEDSEIREALRLGELSWVSLDELPILQKKLIKFYAAQGFFGATIKFECRELEGHCETLQIAITEGARFSCRELVLEGDALEPRIEERLRRSFRPGALAAKKDLDSLVGNLTNELRSEGYISARVRGEYVPGSGPSSKNLLLKIKTGRPTTFIFEGNKRFDAERFLATINLFKRKQPFGNNTINILAQNIERLYREAGYLFVSIDVQKEDSADTQRTTFLVTISEGARVPVQQVYVESETEASSDKLQELVRALPVAQSEQILSPQYAVEEQIQINAAQLQQLLVDEGYAQARVEYRIEPDNESSSVVVRYVVQSGSESLVRELEISGLPPEIELPGAPKLPAATGKINLYLEQVVDFLRQSGYRSPQFQTDLDFQSGKLRVTIASGVLTRIGAIVIEAPAGLQRHVILRNLEFQQGDAWSELLINSSRRRLLKLGLFSRVEIAAQDGEVDTQIENLVVRLGERASRTLEIGGGANSEYGIHLFGEATDRALFSDGRTVAFRLDGYYDPALADISQGVASLKYADPYFLSSEYSLVEDLRYQKFDISTQEFNLDRVSLASYIFRSWENGLSLSSGHTVLQEDLNDVSADAILSALDTGLVRLSYLSGSLGWDKRDNPLNPRSGYNANLIYQLSSEELGSDANYYSLGGRFSFLLPLDFLGPRFSLANNSRAEWAFTFSDTDQIPISQRFYLGGRTSMRGFQENSLGPRGELGGVLGGDTLFSDNLELRYLLGESTSLLTFLDSGRLFLRGVDLPRDDTRYSTGVGVRYLSPIGPIGLDLGHPLDRNGGESALRIHFNIGANF